ncbi:MAG: hypothetical protein JOZ70_10615, partial [Pseudolabrys sp.]|nr:hypothetical protein [Pseudolabrys sp.]
FIMAWGVSFFVHGVLLAPDYATMQGMRAPADTHPLIPFMILAHALFGAAFAWIYFQGKDDSAWMGQGIRFGLAMAAVTVIPMYLIYYVVTPVPFAVLVKQVVFDGIRVVLMGVVLAWINR